MNGTELLVTGGDPDVVRDCPAGYTMDFEQSAFTETGGTDILTPELNTDFGTPIIIIIIINNSTLTEGEPTTATLEYSIAACHRRRRRWRRQEALRGLLPFLWVA